MIFWCVYPIHGRTCYRVRRATRRDDCRGAIVVLALAGLPTLHELTTALELAGRMSR